MWISLPPAASMQLEFLGQSLWWAGVSGAMGVGLIVFSLLARRRALADRGGALSEQRWRINKLVAIAGVGGAAILCCTLLFVWLNGPFGARRDAILNFPLLIFLVLALAAGVFLFYSGVFGSLTPFRRAVLTVLRIGGMSALLLLLFKPVLAFVEGPSGNKPLINIVVDASASMGYNDAPNQPNRYRQSVIAIENTLLPRLSKTYDVRIFAYDGRHAQPLKSPEELETIVPDGIVSDLGAAISSAHRNDASSARAAPPATILFSDGIHNGQKAIQSELMDLRTSPIHTVRVGSSDLEPSTVPDIAVLSVDGPQTAIVNNQVTLSASIKSTAMGDRTVRVLLTSKEANAQAAPIDEQRLVLRSNGSPQTVQLKFTPSKTGRATIRVRVPVDPGERSDINNQQDFSMLVTDPKLAVLYVEGRVRPEVGPLRRTLEQDPNLTAISLVQTVAGRFEMTGLTQGDELKGLPTTLAQWKRFKVIVLGDLDASFLNSQQQKDLEQVVRDGAGLLMIGGQNSFAPGGWDKTPLGSLLPVSLEKVTPAQINTPFVPQMTPLGGGHPIFRGIAQYFLTADGKKAGDTTVPDLSGCVALASAKPAATVLAVHPTEKIAGNPAIVLAVQQFGKGRTAAFAADTTWRWNIQLRAMGKESPYNRFWGQMIRWLASEDNMEKKGGASVTAMMGKERFEAGETVILRAAVTDKEGQATKFAQAWAEVTTPDNQVTKVPLFSKGDDPALLGIYETGSDGDTAYKPEASGTYKVVFTAGKDNVELGRDESTFLVMPAAGEREVLAAQPETLAAISRLTDGTAIELSAAGALAERLAAEAPIVAGSTHTIALSRPRAFFGIFITALALEWWLRRRWQLH